MVLECLKLRCLRKNACGRFALLLNAKPGPIRNSQIEAGPGRKKPEMERELEDCLCCRYFFDRAVNEPYRECAAPGIDFGGNRRCDRRYTEFA